MTVTLLTPAYNAEAFIGRAIESARAQTDDDWEMIISVDPSSDDTVEIVRGALPDPRIRLVIQEHRLGWVGNTNALLGMVETPYFAFLWHDDRLHPEFCRRLVGLLDAHPEAVAAGGAIERTTGEANRQNQSIRGTPFERMRQILANPLAGYDLKSIYRAAPIAAGLRLRHIAPKDYHADRVFALEAAAYGDYLALDEVLYYKHFDPATLSAQWMRDTHGPAYMSAEVAQRAEELAVILTTDLTDGQKQHLVELVFAKGGGRALLSRDDEVADAATAADWQSRVAAAAVVRLMTADLGPTDPVPPLEADPAQRAFAAAELADLAAHAIRHGHRAVAEAQATLALARDPGCAEAHRHMSRLLIEDKETLAERHARAVAHAEAATALAPEDSRVWEALARARYGAGDIDGAREAILRTHALPGGDRPPVRRFATTIGVTLDPVTDKP
ncbi:glycosyltransferase family 2 protein [Acuticoccus mangrovi]|uniref:Glycosyltransferase family 2 protein n=1 Tax=Acuticoccus mangrovi TaxID=2796142 RepID=A0A934INY2_9HYPH|nr:glycosyltransferase family 2 protein [Acuticoccus mangrovi]MBJ3775380.1 glycosyltransferase family 2 protein [Acuticoccus mangrovi]